MKDMPTLLHSITSAYVRDHGTTLGEDVFILNGWIRSRSISNLASCTSVLPNALATREKYACLLQIEAFYKKNSIFSSPDWEATALRTFEQGERICRITNKRLDHYLLNRERLAPDVDRWLKRMERWISSTLGPHVTFLDELPRLVRVTAGATSTRSRREALPHTKVGLKQSCTPSAFKYLKLLAKYFGYPELKMKVCSWNRVEIVPKNWKTGRTIACEPEGNIPLQLAFDSYAKVRLLYKGVNLRDQSRNQSMAKSSSISGEFATVDMKMASDTVAYNAVAALFPYEWFRYLTDIRSPLYVDKEGAYRNYAKFSSMGNGSTFAIETLIFAAACYAVGSKGFSVYGDDIIIETELLNDLKRILRFLGFTINLDKSHSAGPFRESCGVNAYDGIDITPFYIRDMSSIPAVKCHNVNGLVSIAVPGGQLESLCLAMVQEYNLPLVPFCEDTMAGVFVDIPSAYHEKLLKAGSPRNPRHDPQSLYFKRYVAKAGRYRVADSRTLFLWYLDSTRSERERREPLERSWVPTSSHKYVRKWVYWFPPVVGTPLHLYRWSEVLIRHLAD